MYPRTARVRNSITSEEKEISMKYCDFPQSPWQIVQQEFETAQFSEKVNNSIIEATACLCKHSWSIQLGGWK
jgi:hypothetical protein